MSAIKYFKSLAPTTKLNRLILTLMQSEGFKLTIEEAEKLGYTKSLLLQYLGNYPFFTGSIKEDCIKLVLKRKDNPFIKKSMGDCTTKRELVFTFCKYYGDNVRYPIFKAKTLSYWQNTGDISINNYNSNKKIYRYYQVYF